MPPVDAAADPREPRRPAAAVAAALAIGVCADRWIEPPVATAFGLGIAGALLAFVIPTSRRAAVILVLTALGAMSHYAQWRALPATEIARRIGGENQLVRLTGTLAGDPREYDDANSPSWEDPRRSVVDVRCEELDGEDGPVVCTGTIRLYVRGSLGDYGGGDQVRALGWLGPVGGPRNPGEWDRRTMLRARGIRCQMSTDADAVERLRDGWSLSVPSERLRRRCGRRLDELMPARAAAVAKALLLGDRTDLTRDDRRQFVASGTMHLLAISGLHVGLLAAFAAALCRLMGLGPKSSAVVCVLAVVGFALLAEFRPPVLRAVLFVLIAATAWATRRTLDLFNTLCVAAAIVLLATPASLFEPGPQLSFLAVAGLEWGRRLVPSRPAFWPRGPGGFGQKLWDGYRLTLGIAVWTGPLVAANFGLVTPAGYLLNLLLLPFFGLLLAVGFVTLGLLIAAPAFAGLTGVIFGLGLTGLLWIVDRGAALPFGHLPVPPPPTWWLAVLYAGLLGSLLLPIRRLRSTAGRARVTAAMGAWALVLFAAPTDQPVGALRITTLDVGHGSAVLVELPNGRTLLYDCGSLSGGERAADTVAAALRARGKTRLDEVIVSHADIDHFNGLPDLLSAARVGGASVGGVSVGPNFEASGQADAISALDEAARQTPVARLSAGQTRTAGEAAMTILHPRRRLDASSSDNDRSVVLLIEFAGRRALLLGDLEGVPQHQLTRQYLERYGPGVDLLLAPHHGGRRANPPSLALALQPKVVAVSGAQHADPDFLAGSYPDAQLLLTAEVGAVTVTIWPDGRMLTEPFLAGGITPP
ncbi:MAG: ComEC/Rec2 family competence protein, partial [Planctomycetota bacterium]